ncbi:MAG: hypothetical protein HKN62_11450, partial [Phycisphaerales bacterium]|nr:hypothetical protein [Phycisphaerales bacterium]
WSRDRFRDFLAKRDRRLHLELEATHMLGWCIRDVVELFPDARFILTVRDCRSWLDSVINQHLNFNNPRLPEFRRLGDVYHGLPAEPTTPADTVLAHYGLYTLDGYLGYWAAHTQTVLDAVPRGRLLILRTPEITHPDSLAQLARFTGVDPESLDASAGHAYTAAKHHGVIDRLPPDDLDAAIQRHCCPLMMRFFPELAP